MAPLAGKPPFATDEPDFIYETPHPTLRVRKQPLEDPNKRTTAYDVYDDYLNVDDSAKESNRHSGANAVGAGLLTMEDSDEDDSDSETSKPAPLVSKNTALAVATGAAPPPRTQPQHQISIVAPRPGYAAPIAALNNIPSPEPAAPAQGRSSDDTKLPNPFARPSMENPFDPPNPLAVRAQYTPLPPPVPHMPYTAVHPSPAAARAQYTAVSPSPSLPPTPHPLQPPMTPITPVFARPAKTTNITFEDKPKVPRTERTVLPSRGERGDDFWKRFSMVAKESPTGKESNWLKKTRDGYSSFSRWVWCVGLFLLICAAVAIGVWVYIAHNNTNHTAPNAVGGSANEVATSSPITPSLTIVGTSTIRHVSPTNTVARRDTVIPTDLPIKINNLSKSRRHKSRLMDTLF